MKKIACSAIVLLAVACTEQKTADVSVVTYDATGKTVSVFTTADSTDYRLTSTATLEFKEKRQPPENEISVFVDPTKNYQQFLGIGAALTDASAETFAKLPKDKQQEFLKAYFDKENGIGYTIARTNIHSCDFSSGSYTYVSEGDKELKSFNVDHDKQFRIPFIKEAIKNRDVNLQFEAFSTLNKLADQNLISATEAKDLLPLIKQYASHENIYIKEYVQKLNDKLTPQIEHAQNPLTDHEYESFKRLNITDENIRRTAEALRDQPTPIIER